jgi:hypothetical protein
MTVHTETREDRIVYDAREYSSLSYERTKGTALQGKIYERCRSPSPLGNQSHCESLKEIHTSKNDVNDKKPNLFHSVQARGEMRYVQA